MAEPEETGAGQLGMEGLKVSNLLGGFIIALILSLGGVIVYQSYQIDMAVKMISLLNDNAAKNK